jgi:hypothetical protein
VKYVGGYGFDICGVIAKPPNAQAVRCENRHNDHVDPKTDLVILATVELGFTNPVDHYGAPWFTSASGVALSSPYK